MLLRSMYLDSLFKFNVSEVCELLFYFLSRGSSCSVTQMFPLMSWCQLKINVYIIYTFIFKFHKYYMWNISMKWKSKGEFFLFWWSFNVIMWSHYIVYRYKHATPVHSCFTEHTCESSRMWTLQQASAYMCICAKENIFLAFFSNYK